MRYPRNLTSLIAMAAALASPITTASAQTYTTSERVPDWSNANAGTVPTKGDGVQRGTEIYNVTQGGTPPAMAFEPADINGGANYSDYNTWLTTFPAGTCVSTDLTHTTPYDTGCRPDNGEAKFRIACPRSHSSRADPITAHGNPLGPHLHTFFGDYAVDQNSTYVTLRNSPKSNCEGGPLAASGYWSPELMEEVSPGVYAEVLSEISIFYYTTNYPDMAKLVRIPNGMAFIGGVDPSDRYNTGRLAELGSTIDKEPVPTSGAKYMGTGSRYNGWQGWQCTKRTDAQFSNAPQPVLDPNNTADEIGNSGYTRKLLNDDGSDPYNGTCEGPAYEYLAVVDAPPCWDGYNLTSPNGRKHFRYKVHRGDNAGGGMCPNGWWEVPIFEVKTFFPALTFAHRKKWFLSSDRMDTNPANWQPAGSTFHFDWMNGWDRRVMTMWNLNCNGMTINGVTGQGRTCGTGVVAPNTSLRSGTSPDTNMAPNGFGAGPSPNGPSKTVYSPVIRDGRYNSKTTGPVTMDHMNK